MRVLVLLAALLMTVSCASVPEKPDGAPQPNMVRTVKVCTFNLLVALMSNGMKVPDICSENDMTRKETDL